MSTRCRSDSLFPISIPIRDLHEHARELDGELAEKMVRDAVWGEPVSAWFSRKNGKITGIAQKRWP
jgi:hypothetical protein